MKYFIPTFLFVFVLFSCSEKENTEKAIEFKDFKERLSYTLGADHARAISESGDPNFNQYNLDEIVKGFSEGLKDEKSFDEACKNTMQKLIGENGSNFDASYAKEGSNCIGKISGIFFTSGWKQKKALDKIDMKFVKLGFEQGLRKIDSIIPRQEQASIVQNFMWDMNKQNGISMLENAKKLKNTVSTSSGLVLETLQEGKGGNPSPSDDVLAHYILMNSSGDTLQSSFKMVELYKQKLTAFSLLSVVPGWTEGIPMMKKGGKYKLYLPFHLAYGEQGMFNPQTQSYDIQPFESLVFYIELLNYGKAGSLTSK
jgi:FKBP-type peptidyl-prolyl cis-trans isomerase FkpA